MSLKTSGQKKDKRSWIDGVEDAVLFITPLLFRFVEWAIVLGALWYVSAKAHSRWPDVIVMCMIAAWTSYLVVTVQRWFRARLPHRFQSGWIGLLALLPAMGLAYGLTRTAILVSADITGASLSDREREIFFMPSAERDRIRQALEFERLSGARPPYPEQVVTGIASGVVSTPGPSGGVIIGIAVTTDTGEIRTGSLVADFRGESGAPLLALLEAAAASRRRVSLTSCFGDLLWPVAEVGVAKQPHGSLMVHQIDVEGHTFKFPCYWIPPKQR